MKSRLAWFALLFALLAVAVWLAVPRPTSLMATQTVSPKVSNEAKHQAVPAGITLSPGPPSAKAETSPLRPRSTWRNVGNGTPATAFETLFWAKEQPDLIALANVLGMSDETRARAAEIFATMSPLARSRLAVNSPEQLLAFLYATSPFVNGLRVRTEKQNDYQNATITGDLQMANDRVVTADFHFRSELGGWRYVVDEANARSLLDHWEQSLKVGEK